MVRWKAKAVPYLVLLLLPWLHRGIGRLPRCDPAGRRPRRWRLRRRRRRIFKTLSHVQYNLNRFHVVRNRMRRTIDGSWVEKSEQHRKNSDTVENGLGRRDTLHRVIRWKVPIKIVPCLYPSRSVDPQSHQDRHSASSTVSRMAPDGGVPPSTRHRRRHRVHRCCGAPSHRWDVPPQRPAESKAHRDAAARPPAVPPC